MSTAENPDALTRRIERLAAASVDDAGEGAALAALVGALRTEIAGLRASVGALRGDTGAVRDQVASLAERLDGVAGAGQERDTQLTGRVSDVSARVELLAGRLEELSDVLPPLSEQVREGFRSIPVDTGQRLDAATAELAQTFGSRLEGVAGELSAALSAGLDRAADTAADTAAATTAGMDEAQSTIEGRLAVLEDTLDAVSERLEALAREIAATTGESLEALSGRMSDLDRRLVSQSAEASALAGERQDAVEARLAVLGPTLLDRLGSQLQERDDALRAELLAAVEADREQARQDREAVTELAVTVRGALDGFASVVDRSLSELGRSMTAALSEGREETRSELDEVTERFAATTSGLQADLLARDEAAATRLAAVQAWLVSRDEVAAGRLSALERSLEATVESAVDTASQEVRTEQATALSALRADLETGLGVVGARVDEAQTGLGGALHELRAEVDELVGGTRDRLLAAAAQSAQAADEAASGLRQELGSTSQGLREALASASQGAREQLASTALELRGELASTSQGVRDELASAREESSTAAQGLHDELATSRQALQDHLDTASSALREELAATSQAVSGELEASSRGLREELASTTQGLHDHLGSATSSLREELLARVQQSSEQLAERLAGLSAGLARTASESAEQASQRAAALTAVSEQTQSRLEDVRTELGTQVDALATSLGGRVLALEEAFEGRVRELESTLAARLVQLGGEVEEGTARSQAATERLEGLAALAARQQSEISSALDAVRADVTTTTGELRTQLLAATEEQLSGLTARVDRFDAALAQTSEQLTASMAGVGATVAQATEASGRASEGLAEVRSSTAGLEQTVAGFREEWPTRTFEVVQGAKAVAEGVVREVRLEVQAQLNRVRAELARAVQTVQGAGDELDAGTDRLSSAGRALVSYLEHRDRLLEAERDRVLLDVLETFASGLSTRERAALSGRMGDALARRRDSRDAQRYRGTASPLPPAEREEMPEEVRRLVVPPSPASPSGGIAGERPAGPSAPTSPPLGPDEGGPTAPRPGSRTIAAAAGAGAPRREGTVVRAPAARSVSVRPAPGSGVVKTVAPAPPPEGERGGKAAERTDDKGAGKSAGRDQPNRDTSASAVPARGGSGPERRGRLDAMPQVPGAGRVLDAAAPPPAASPGSDVETSGSQRRYDRSREGESQGGDTTPTQEERPPRV